MLDNLSGSLGDFVNRKLQRMQIADQMRALQRGENPYTVNDLMDSGLGGHSLSQSLSLEDLLQDRSQNMVGRSTGKTPIRFPAPQQPIRSPGVQGVPPAMNQSQMPQVQQAALSRPPENESAVDKKERLLRERNEIKERNAIAKEERIAQRAREKEEREEKTKKQLHIDKETLPVYKKIKAVSATIPEVDARLDEMEELLGTGNVQWYGFLDSLSHVPYIGPFAGAIEQAFLTTESQVFKKLSTDFLRDAKPYFGSNMSTSEVKLFLERVPSLMLSNEGNRALIRNFRSLNDYSKEVDKILEGIIAENGGERPRHLESKLQERLGPATNKLRKSFRESVKLIPQSDVSKLRNEEKGRLKSYGSKKFIESLPSLIPSPSMPT